MEKAEELLVCTINSFRWHFFVFQSFCHAGGLLLKVYPQLIFQFPIKLSGVLETNFIKPTHDKQDFEKSVLYQRLESRLKEMTYEYW